MQWSKLKSRIEQFFTPTLRGRVELRSVRYRGAHDQEGRGYITVDGVEVWSMCSLKHEQIEWERITKTSTDTGLPRWQAQKHVQAELEREGVLSQYGYYRSLEQYCNNSIEENLSSANVLLRALAMIDSRVGRRRLDTFPIGTEHQMVIYFHELRKNANERTAA
jgi:hypothetical protein